MGILEDVLGIGIILVIAYVGWNALSGGLLGGKPAAAAPAPIGGAAIWTASWPGNAKTGFKNNQMCLDQGGSTLVKNSDGTATVSGSSPRVSARGDFGDVDCSVSVENTGAGAVDMRPKTEHFCGSPKTAFGGYIVLFELSENKVWFKKEESHASGYSPRTASKSFQFPKGWINLRGIVYNSGNGVKLEAYVNNTKVSETLDTGNMKGKPYTEPTSQSAVRFNLMSKHTTKQVKSMKIKDFVVRQIGGRSVPKQSAYAPLYYPRIPMSLSS